MDEDIAHDLWRQKHIDAMTPEEFFKFFTAATESYDPDDAALQQLEMQGVHHES